MLNARGWDHSERIDQAWALLAAEHQLDVHVLARVIPFEPPRQPRVKRTPRTKGAG
jgi:hypothetical protein